jgi:hypothetical protein
MRFVLLAIAGMWLSIVAHAGNVGVLLENVPQALENKPAVIGAVKSAFLARHWTIVGSDESSVTATISGKVTSSRMVISVSGSSVMYDETTTRLAQASHAPAAITATVRSKVKLDSWLENIRRDVTVNVAGIPLQRSAPGSSLSSRTAAERLMTLDELRATGTITEDEYAKKRAEILGAL